MSPFQWRLGAVQCLIPCAGFLKCLVTASVNIMSDGLGSTVMPSAGKSSVMNLSYALPSVTIAQWWRARHSRKLVIRNAPGSIPVENTSHQIHMDLST